MKTLLLLPLLFSWTAYALSPEFSFHEVGDGFKCLNSQQQEGLNPKYLGECGQVSGMDFDKEQGQGLQLWGTRASGAVFMFGDISGSFFWFTDFSKAHFDNVQMDNLDISESNFSDVITNMNTVNSLTVSNSDLRRVEGYRMAGAQMQFYKVNASNANFSFSLFPQLTCVECLFISTNLYRISMRDSLFVKSDFSNADLQMAILSGAAISESQFSGAKLSFANLDGTVLDTVSFSGAQLTGANFLGARISGCDFSGADLRAANLSSVTLTGVNKWRGARFDSATKLPFGEEQALKEGMVKDVEHSLKSH